MMKKPNMKIAIKILYILSYLILILAMYCTYSYVSTWFKVTNVTDISVINKDKK